MRHYVAIVLWTLLTLGAAATAFNLVIDPYAVFGSAVRAGINKEKPALSTGERVYKSRLAHSRADTVILGTSRSEVGLDPRSPAFGADNVLNLATSNQPYRETLELLQLAASHGTRRAIIGLDFFPANDFRHYPPSYQPGSYAPGNLWTLAASLTTLQASVNTLRNQNRQVLAAVGAQLRADGMRMLGNEYVLSQGGHARLFMDTEASYFRDAYPESPAFGVDLDGSRASEMNCAFRILEFAHTHGIELHVFISPSHARLWETLFQAGLWDKWEAWKRRLAGLAQRAAELHGTGPFTITDFSGFNAYTTEEVPVSTRPQQNMRWYIETSHYRPELGELVLQRLLGGPSPNPDESFGTPLTTVGIESTLSSIRVAHGRWRSEHPRDVAEIAFSKERSVAARQRNAAIRTPVVNQGCD